MDFISKTDISEINLISYNPGKHDQCLRDMFFARIGLNGNFNMHLIMTTIFIEKGQTILQYNF